VITVQREPVGSVDLRNRPAPAAGWSQPSGDSGGVDRSPAVASISGKLTLPRHDERFGTPVTVPLGALHGKVQPTCGSIVISAVLPEPTGQVRELSLQANQGVPIGATPATGQILHDFELTLDCSGNLLRPKEIVTVHEYPLHLDEVGERVELRIPCRRRRIDNF